MTSVKQEMVIIEFTNNELQELIMAKIDEKYPELKDWVLEDFLINYNSKKLDDKCVTIMYAKMSDYPAAEQTSFNFPVTTITNEEPKT